MAGLYIHVPFCVKRCVYCDFFSHTQMRYKESYLSAVVEEMAMRRDYLAGETLETVYFGGGTPSTLTAAEWEQIFEAIYRLFPVGETAEITLEANPDDMTPAYVSSLRRLPFNRISMGVQSFRDEDLRFLCRRHTARQATEAVGLCRENGYGNLSIDLMYGLPGQTAALWEQNLEEALRLDIVHLSAYHLTYEEGTRLYRMKEAGHVRPVDEELSLSLFTMLTTRLKDAGYLHYEISSFARPGFLSRHNSAYWTGKKYLGIGPSAHSYDTGSRQWNVSSLQHYIKGIQKKVPCIETELLNIHNKYNEYILTRLRTCRGISLSYILTNFGEEKYNYCIMQAKRLVDTGFLRQEGDKLLLSGKGIFVSDGLMCDLLWVDSYTKHGV
ncbi:MAG: radical SAM family heme chaperone HemW [Tannerellaceae bacterium]|jgi:oxygen-independent coproporphyrinogen-3 oxidase|nr:radical SAM family heme chaperone HemW [Tannerellaceae bacterium]